MLEAHFKVKSRAIIFESSQLRSQFRRSLSLFGTLSDMGPLLVQEANVAAHELQDFGGVGTARPMAFDVHEPA